MIYVIARIFVQPQHCEAFAVAVKTLVAESLKDPGCLGFDCSRSCSEPDQFLFTEWWESQELLTAHGSTPHVAAWRALSRPMWSGPSKAEIVTAASVVRR